MKILCFGSGAEVLYWHSSLADRPRRAGTIKSQNHHNLASFEKEDQVMKKIIVVLIMALLLINVAYPALDQMSASMTMTQSELSCTIGGTEGIDCDDVLTICLSFASGFWEKLACLVLWGACKLLIE
jgi:hypothetical protein